VEWNASKVRKQNQKIDKFFMTTEGRREFVCLSPQDGRLLGTGEVPSHEVNPQKESERGRGGEKKTLGAAYGGKKQKKVAVLQRPSHGNTSKKEVWENAISWGVSMRRTKK